MFFDIHSHILPDVDDGAQSIDTTRRMLEFAYQQGIRRMMATPHFYADMDAQIFPKWKQAYNTTSSLAREIDLNFTIHRGAEVYYDSRIIPLLKQGAPLSLHGSRFILVEFPGAVDFTYLTYAVRELQYAGYRPVLAHIERYRVLQNERNVAGLCEMGVWMQVNAGTVAGKSGLGVRRYILRLIRKGYIHIIGTDAHGVEVRQPLMIKCAAILDKKVGSEIRDSLCRRNFMEILKGEEHID